jgi:uncharacterized protein
MLAVLRHLPDLAFALLAVGTQIAAGRAALKHGVVARSRGLRLLVRAVVAALSVLILLAVALYGARVARHFPLGFAVWTRTIGLCWAILSLMVYIFALIARLVPGARPHYDAGRRRALLAVRGAVFAAPAVAAGYAIFVQRGALSTREVNVPIRGLPKELDDVRIVQVSDIHLSPFLSRTELARAVDMANETRADLALVTGDLITSAYDPLDTCIAEIARLRSGSVTLGCLGNHEIYADAEDYATAQCAKVGIDFLRSASRVVKLRGRDVNFAGVDYQPLHKPYLVGAEKLIRPGMPNILLSHNPDVFPVAARQGYDLTISGHTHGGQIAVEILRQNVSVARFYTPYVYGLYRTGRSAVYVTRGIGTVGVPARLGAPPEVALIRLCAI